MTHQHLSDDQLRAALVSCCDYLVSRPKLEPACRAAGFHSKQIYRWLKKSNDGDPRFLIKWPDESGEPIQFAHAVQAALRMWKLKFSTTLMEDCELGHPKILCDRNGDVIYEKDSALLAKWGGDTPDAKRAAEDFGGIFDYPFKHKINPDTGELERLPAIEFEQAPAALRQHVSKSLLPGFNPVEHRTQTNSYTGTVLVIDGKARYARSAEQIDTPMVRELRERLAQLKAKGPANPSPRDANGNKTLPIGLKQAVSDPLERVGGAPHRPPPHIGHGNVPPGGYKVV